MSAKSPIEWTDATWTPIRARVKDDAAEIARAKGYASLVQIAERMAGHVGPHCEHVSPECLNCYSETNNSRCLPFNGTGLPFDRRSRDLVEMFVDRDILDQPLHWRKPRKIFVCSQTDLFGEFVPCRHIDKVFAIMSQSPDHVFQLLTKRAETMREYMLSERTSEGIDEAGVSFGWCHANVEGRWPLPNVWLGVSVGCREYKHRIDALRGTAAAVRFLSLEPLLEDLGELDLRGIHWVIAGSESGRGARQCERAWVRLIKDQCVAAGVPFFWKQEAIRGKKIPTPELDGTKWVQMPGARR